MANKMTINEEVCKGCGLCISVCPKKILAISPNRINSKGYKPSTMTDIAQCIACGMCAIMCPDSAITVEKE